MADRTHLAWLEEHAELICGELNVKKVDFADRADHYINYTVLPDLKRLGPRLGKRLPAVKKLLAEADGGALLAELKSQGKVTFRLPDGPVVLDADDIQVRLQAKEGWAAAQGKACVVVLSTELNEDLIREGIAREVARTVNDRRKEMNCQFTDRVEIAIVTESAELRAAIEQFRDYIMTETLAVSIGFEPMAGVEPVDVEIGDYRAQLYIRRHAAPKQVLSPHVKMSTVEHPFRIAVLISGGGTTLKNLIEKIEAGRLHVQIALVISSSPNARGLQFAARRRDSHGSRAAELLRVAGGVQPGDSRSLPGCPGRPGGHGRIPQAGDDRGGLCQSRDEHPPGTDSGLLRPRLLRSSRASGRDRLRGKAQRLHDPLCRQPVRPRPRDPPAGRPRAGRRYGRDACRTDL